jgi:hypothetical protein
MRALLLWVIWATQSTSGSTSERPAAFTQFLELDLRYGSGRLEIEKIKRTAADPPRPYRRFPGRFEARLEERDGGRTVDSFYFDVPLLREADNTDDMTLEARKLGEKIRSGVKARFHISVPLPPGATRLSIIDGKTKHKAAAIAIPATVDRPPAPPDASSDAPR